MHGERYLFPCLETQADSTQAPRFHSLGMGGGRCACLITRVIDQSRLDHGANYYPLPQAALLIKSECDRHSPPMYACECDRHSPPHTCMRGRLTCMPSPVPLAEHDPSMPLSPRQDGAGGERRDADSSRIVLWASGIVKTRPSALRSSSALSHLEAPSGEVLS